MPSRQRSERLANAARAMGTGLFNDQQTEHLGEPELITAKRRSGH
jgi:hypothetical protein